MKIMKLSGPPGSGKTTVLSAIKRDFLERNYQVIDASTWTKIHMHHNLSLPHLSRRAVLLIDNTGPHMADWLESQEAKELAPDVTVVYTWTGEQA